MSSVFICSAGGVNGVLIDPLDVQPDQINIEQMFWTLSGISRFNGSIKEHWSVAHHLIHCDEIAKTKENLSDADRLHILVHDLHEAITGDISTPMKEMIGREQIRRIEQSIDSAIYQAIGIERPDNACIQKIKEVDVRALHAEALRFCIDLGYPYPKTEQLDADDMLINGVKGSVMGRTYEETRDLLTKELVERFTALKLLVEEDASLKEMAPLMTLG